MWLLPMGLMGTDRGVLGIRIGRLSPMCVDGIDSTLYGGFLSMFLFSIETQQTIGRVLTSPPSWILNVLEGIDGRKPRPSVILGFSLGSALFGL